MGTRSHFWRYVQSATQEGASLQVSVVVGAHPVFYLLAASFIENEYAIAANLIGATFTNGVTNRRAKSRMARIRFTPPSVSLRKRPVLLFLESFVLSIL